MKSTIRKGMTNKEFLWRLDEFQHLKRNYFEMLIKEGSSHSNWSYCLRFSDVMWPLLVLLLFIPSYDASAQILSKGRKSLDLINPCISYMLSIIHFTPYSTGPVPLTLISNTQQPLADVLQNRCL